MSGAIEAVHIFDENNNAILSHVYCSRPLKASQLLPLYLAHPVRPRPSLIYLPNSNPPTVVFSLCHANLLLLLTSSSEIEPLLALEFLHRVVDVCEEFLGAPLLSSKIESNYDIVAQLLSEMCDAGTISTTEGNALRDLVEVEGLMGKLLGSINIPGKPGTTTPSSGMQGISSLGSSMNAPSLPWRRSNVRHTSNELYIDLVETLSVTMAPSGRPLAAFANGSIACTSKLSGVPDLVLVLSTPSGSHNFDSVMELPVFHPCVRLAKWRERPGTISFIPPDGRFVLAGYEVDLLPFTSGKSSSSSNSLRLPVNIDVKTSLGSTGSEFEVRTTLSKIPGSSGNSNSGFSTSSGRASGPGSYSIGRGGGGFGNAAGSSSSPILEDLVVTVPIPKDVRTLTDIRASRGDTTYNPGDATLEWIIPVKETGPGVATLRCTVVSSIADEEELEGNGFSFNGSTTGYNYNESSDTSSAYQSTTSTVVDATSTSGDNRDERKIARNKMLMPSSTRVSFSVKGWLPSGIKVEKLDVDKEKSRGIGEHVKPYKGVKYLCVSSGGVEVRC